MSAFLLHCLIAFFAALVFALVLGGWRDGLSGAQAGSGKVSDPVPDQYVSMIVPARDAAGTLVPLLQDLYAQRYPKELLEVLVVDDHSSDSTASAVRGMMRNWPQLRLISAMGEGKKAAIAQGVAEARGEWMVLTDADARCRPLRVAHIMRKAKGSQVDMLILPVETRGGGSWIERIQVDEQKALLGVAVGTALSGTPMLANGANMAFSKAAFVDVGGYEGDRWASGDDIFLLHRMLKAGRKVTYLLDPEVVVTVKAERTVAQFSRQRLRWAGKMRGLGGTGAWSALAGLLLPWYLIYVSCSFGLTDIMTQRPIACLLLLASAWMLWLLPVLALTRAVGRFLHAADDQEIRHEAGLTTLLSLVVFTVYAPIFAIVSLFFKPKWKGRPI